MKRRHLYLAVAAALALGGSAWAADQTRDQLRTQDQTRDQLQTPDQTQDQLQTRDRTRDQLQTKDKDGPIYGSQLMTNEERIEYRNRMRTATSAEEREQLRLEHHKQMQERAKERGVTLPDVPPPRGLGRGRGPGAGMGGAAGPGGGYGRR